MKPIEKFVASLIVCVSLGCAALVYCVLATPLRLQGAPVEASHLPGECAEYYNDGTDRWADCMGVEPK